MADPPTSSENRVRSRKLQINTVQAKTVQQGEGLK